MSGIGGSFAVVVISRVVRKWILGYSFEKCLEVRKFLGTRGLWVERKLTEFLGEEYRRPVNSRPVKSGGFEYNGNWVAV